MNTFLLNRAQGSVSHQALARAHNDRLIHSLQPASNVIVSYQDPPSLNDDHDEEDEAKTAVAHPAGVNSITIDRFEGR